MSRLLSGISCFALCALYNHAWAEGGIPKPLALVCHFSLGFSSTYTDGGFAETTKESDFQITYASIDAPNRTAQMIGNMGASAVTFIDTGMQLLFVEQTPAGNFDFTSVLPASTSERLFEQKLPAAHSRHMRTLDDFLISQYTGFCEPRY